MRTFPRPVVVASRCLGFAACRYDGAMIPDEFMERLKAHVEFRPVCPEMEIGLGVPREKIRVVRSGRKLRLVQPATGRDLTDVMARFAESLLNSIQRVHGFILKSRSPSCGIRDVKIFSGPEGKSPVGRGSGFYGAAVLERFPDLPVEDEGRLSSFKLREHFLTRLFALAAFDEMARPRSLKALVEFHSANQLLLSSYGQKVPAALGQIVANRERRPLDRLLPDYRLQLGQAMARSARCTANIKVLMHALGHFSRGLTGREKALFLKSLEKYRTGKLPLCVPRGILKSWIARFDEKYLARQTFFDPYPEALMEVTDSGKRRDG